MDTINSDTGFAEVLEDLLSNNEKFPLRGLTPEAFPQIHGEESGGAVKN
jgi:hypothetical protein